MKKLKTDAKKGKGKLTNPIKQLKKIQIIYEKLLDVYHGF